jgi:hypothetical protein
MTYQVGDTITLKQDPTIKGVIVEVQFNGYKIDWWKNEEYIGQLPHSKNFMLHSVYVTPSKSLEEQVKELLG